MSRLHAALEGRGVRLIDGPALSPTWVDETRGSVDVVHLHWLEYIVRADGNRRQRLVGTHARTARYVVALGRLRAAGIRVVWTVHNQRPHERRYPWLDEPLMRHTAARVDGFLFHSRTAARQFATELGTSLRAWIGPLPHYRGTYPSDGRPRAVQRAAYGLDNASFVYLMFGQIRGYKRIPDAIRAFLATGDIDARLIVAGAPINDRAADEIHAAAGGDPRVLLLLRFVPDDEVSTLFELADATVLNYREVFSSAVLLLALSYGVPVVAPDQGSAREVAAGDALETFSEGQLPRSLRAIRTGDPAARRAAALRAIEPCTYDALADEVLRAYLDEGGTDVVPALQNHGRREPHHLADRAGDRDPAHAGEHEFLDFASVEGVFSHGAPRFPRPA
jgi:beta-1,4-mannosyltransferase